MTAPRARSQMAGVRALVPLVFLFACGSDPCDAFPDESCLSFEVRAGSAAVATLDQLHLAATSGFALSDGVSPPQPRRFTLPVQLAVLPGPTFAGPFSLLVRGFRDGSERGRDEVRGAIARPRQHLRQVATLFPDGAPGVDLAGVDLAGADLAGLDFAGVDFASRPDLASSNGWTVQQLPNRGFVTVWGSSDRDIYIGGGDGAIYHSTGDDQWTLQTPRIGPSVTSLFGLSASDLYATLGDFGFDRTVLHSTGNGVWTGLPMLANPDQTVLLLSIWGTSATNLYVGAEAIDPSDCGLWKLTGSAVSPQLCNAAMSMTQTTARTIFGTAADDVWAGGLFKNGKQTASTMVHSTGDGTWQPEQGVDAQIKTIWASSRSDVYAGIGADAIVEGFHVPTGVYHRDAPNSWSLQTSENELHILGIWGSSASDVWAVGALRTGPLGAQSFEGVVLRSTGNGQWTHETGLPSLGLLRAVFGARAGDVYVVGNDGIVAHKRQ